jgi:hypothetical protein
MAMYRSSDMVAYVVNHGGYYGHAETGGDTRKNLNSGR